MTKSKIYRCIICGEVQIGPRNCQYCDSRTRPDGVWADDESDRKEFNRCGAIKITRRDW